MVEPTPGRRKGRATLVTKAHVTVATDLSPSDMAAVLVRGVMIDNVRATGAILTLSITGIPGSAVRDVSLSNIRIETAEGGKREWADLKIPEKTNAYPEARMFGRLASYRILLPPRERFADGQRRSGLQRA